MLNVKKADEIEAKMQKLFTDATVTRSRSGIKFNTRQGIDLGALDQLNQLTSDTGSDILIKRSGTGLVIIFS